MFALGKVENNYYKRNKVLWRSGIKTITIKLPENSIILQQYSSKIRKK